MTRDEFLLLVEDGETLDTDTVMAEYDRLTDELAAVKKIIEDGSPTYVGQINALLDEREALKAEMENLREWSNALQKPKVLTRINEQLEAENTRLREVLVFHLRTHENIPAHGSARHMAMLEQLHQHKTNNVPIDRNSLPACDCDTCVKARAALED